MKKANSNALVVAATIMTAILVFSDLGCALAGEESSPTKVELSRNNRYGLDKEKVVVAISSGYVPFFYDSKEGEESARGFPVRPFPEDALHPIIHVFRY